MDETRRTMMLDGKNAIIYGGGGAIGGAMARAFAREGAHVFLAGRTRTTLEAMAEEIRKSGGQADTAVVDALDEDQVDAHADAVGRLDISVNVITDSDVQGTPIADMSVADYLSPVDTSVRARFLTSRAAARQMRAQRSGVILFFGGQGDLDAHRKYRLGGLLTGFAAVEEMRRQLAAELGEYGIRVITLRTGGVPEAIPAEAEFRQQIEAELTQQSLLGRTATLDDVGNVAVFAVSDLARTLTGTAINMTCGAILD